MEKVVHEGRKPMSKRMSKRYETARTKGTFKTRRQIKHIYIL